MKAKDVRMFMKQGTYTLHICMCVISIGAKVVEVNTFVPNISTPILQKITWVPFSVKAKQLKQSQSRSFHTIKGI